MKDKFDKKKICYLYKINYVQLDKLFIYNYCKINFV